MRPKKPSHFIIFTDACEQSVVVLRNKILKFDPLEAVKTIKGPYCAILGTETWLLFKINRRNRHDIGCIYSREYTFYAIIIHIEFVNRMHSETIVAHANILKPTCGPANLDHKISHFSRVEQMYLSVFLVLFRTASLIVMVKAMINAFLLDAWTVRYMYTHEFP